MSTKPVNVDILLHEIEHACQQLLSCLQQEAEVLGQRHYDSLISLSQPKQLLIEKLDALDEQVKTNKAVLQHARWPNLRHNLQQCQLQNASNGRLLARSYQISQETLSILSGRGKVCDTTYNASGFKQTSTASLSNVTA